MAKGKKTLCSLIIFLMFMQLTFFTASGEALSDPSATYDYVEGEVLVKYKTSALSNRISMDSLNLEIGADVIDTFDSISGLQLVNLPEEMSVEEALDFYGQNSQIDYVEPNYIYQTDSTLVPNDTNYPLLWGANNIGQTIKDQAGISDADMDLPEAWAINTGSSAIVIAVIDTGVKYDHPDLIENIWSNSDEIAGNGIDDDDNGYIDDIRGWDFFSNDNNPMDLNLHGTHVSGIIAGVGNNNLGVAGVMWDAQIMPIRVIGPTGARTTDIIKAIQYANANGADIINVSLGGGSYSQSMKDAFDASTALIVCSAGNSACDNDITPHYPSSFSSENIISVASTDNQDRLALSSNYGVASVDVAAPGVSIYSTLSIGDYSEGDTLLSDPMETMTNWLMTPLDSWELSDTNSGGAGNTKSMYSAFSNNNQDYSLKLASPLDFSTVTYPMLEFQLKLDTADSGDALQVAYSTNDDDGLGSYFVLDSYTGNFEFTTIDINLSSLSGKPKVWIAFVLTSDGSGFSGGAYIDNLKIKKTEQTLSGYDYRSGTSMATPQVTGLAGLIKSKNPVLTALEIKTIILNTVENVESLSGKVMTSGRVNAYRALTDNPIVTGVSLTPETLTMTAGGATATLIPTISPDDATIIDVIYISSTPAVATVSNTGIVTAVSAGTTTITVTTVDGHFQDSTVVTVGLPSVTGVNLTPDTLALTVGGETATLTATVSPDTANQNVTWSSDYPEIATVTNGVVTAVSPGSAIITATTVDGSFTDTCAVTITSIPITGVTLDTNTLTLTAGGATATLVATVAPANASNKTLTYSSSEPTIASVAQNGVVTPLIVGSTIITVTTADGHFQDSTVVTVGLPPVTGVSLTPDTLALTVGGETATLTATVSPDTANQNVTWSSDYPEIATVTNGVVTAVSPGSAIITVTTVDGSFTATCNVTVNNVAVNSITLNPTSLNLTVGGATSTIVANILPNNASDKSVTWSSSAPSLASVANGVVTAVASGTATITATAVGGLSDTCSVTVTPAAHSGGGGGGGGRLPAVPLVEVPVSSTVIKEEGELVQEIAVVANSDGSVSIDQDSVERLLKDATTNKVTSLTLSIESTSASQDDFTIKLPADLFSDAKAIGVDSISFDTTIAKITMGIDSLGTLSKNAKTIVLTITELVRTALSPDQLKTVGSYPVYDFNLMVDNQPVSKFQGDKPVEIIVPYKLQSGENPENIVVYFLNDQGELERLNFSHFNPKTGEITFHTSHFSKYTVMQGKKHAFTDLTEFQWAAESVSALFTRQVINGMSTTHFDPKGILTKGQFVKMLIYALNITSANTTKAYSDVPTSHWAFASTQIAIDSGIVEATSETLFGVNQSLTREDMAVLCYRAVLKKNIALKANVNMKPLTDIDDLSEFSKKAITTLYSAGIINGEAEGIFNPKGVLNRATASTIIYRIYMRQ